MVKEVANINFGENAGVDKEEDKQNFQQRIKGKVNTNWLLLENQSTIHRFIKKEYRTNIHQVNRHYHVH